MTAFVEVLPPELTGTTCAIDRCRRPVKIRGHCHPCYKRLRRSGALSKLATQATPAPQRFWPKVRRVTDGCWEWLGALSGGYGRFLGGDGRLIPAHRWSYEHLVGPIPDGLQLDHLCRNPRCVRPDHLEPVTAVENQKRGKRSTQTHCYQGHALAEAYVDKHGHRFCRQCRRDRARAYYAAKVAR